MTATEIAETEARKKSSFAILQDVFACEAADISKRIKWRPFFPWGVRANRYGNEEH